MSEITATEYRQRLAAAVRAEFGRKKVARSELTQILDISRPTATSRWLGLSPYDADEIEKIAARLGITEYNLNESAALGEKFDKNTPDDEVARITPPQVDVFAQPARSKRRAS
jgi:transcriptional regulator with XRE-family HTH domain